MEDFPVFSLQIRDLRLETGSLQTVPTATQSAAAETLRSQRGASQKIPRFRGVLADRLRATEPETEGSGHSGRCHPRFSLLPSWAVRIRFLFALAKQGSVGKYFKFEYYSLRHLVRGVGDCATEALGGGGSSREFAGFWVGV